MAPELPKPDIRPQLRESLEWYDEVRGSLDYYMAQDPISDGGTAESPDAAAETDGDDDEETDDDVATDDLGLFPGLHDAPAFCFSS